MRVYLEAFGCSQNLGEGAALRRDIERAGHPVVGTPEGADVGVIVTCGVIGSTEARMVRRWQALVGRIPRVVVTGCLVPLRSGLFAGPGSERTIHLPIRSQHELPALLAQWGAATPAVEPVVPSEPEATAEVILAQGCTSHCTYCFSRLARGRLSSVGPLDVLARIAAARDRGAVEIRLSSLDTSCWGMDLPDSGRLPALAESIAHLPGDFRV
ncbi:MAG TPA: hypothetical protein VGS18_00025, partial [Thermoplasmata archaeon]|nr:hypothetical protein [Thermoplasmata archaeon]